MPTRSEIAGTPRLSSSACSTPTTPVMPSYGRRDQTEATRQLGAGGAAGDRRRAAVRHRLGAGADRDDRLATEGVGDDGDRLDVGPPVHVRLDADEHHDVAVAGVALEDELVRRPEDLADVVVDRDLRALLGEVVERVGVDRADGRRAWSALTKALTAWVAAPAASNQPSSPTSITGAPAAPMSPVLNSSTSVAFTRESPVGAGRRRSASGEGGDDVVDADGQRLDVGRVDRREHADAQLVAAELAVAVGVEDAVGPQRGADVVGGDRVVEVDGADDLRALRRIADERRRPRRGPRPSRRASPPTARCARRRTRRPPLPSIHWICASSMTSVARAGVL